MVPFFTTQASPVDVPPPPSFRPLVGEVRSARHGGIRPASSGGSAAQSSGVRFERKVLEALGSDYAGKFRCSPIIHFFDESGYRTCVPDGVLVLDDRVVVVEVKTLHTSNAWWQLRHLYGPVLEKLYLLPVRLVEIVQTYDSVIPFPEKVELIESLEDAPEHTIGVLRWRR